jgi:Zn-dependent protease/CBS domain-containing protein
VRIGRVLGIDLRLDTSWFVIFILISWSLASNTFPLGHPGWAAGRYWLLALATSLLFFASVVAHELGHSVVAQATGVPVRDITLFLFGGVATLGREPRRPRDELLIALAGPAASLALAAGFGALWRLSAADAPLHALAGWLAMVNLSLALFNLVPGFPLDGGRVFRALVWGLTGDLRRATRIAASLGRIVAFGVIAWGVWQIFVGNWAGGLWIAFIGWFLHSAAAGTHQQTVLEELLAGHTAREVMLVDCPRVPRRLTLDVLVDQIVLPSGRRCFPVVEDGQLVGLVTLHQVQEVPRDRWPTTRVEAVMIGRPDLLTVRVDDELATVFERMATEGLNQFPVLEGDRLAGMVTRESLLAFVQLRSTPAT